MLPLSTVGPHSRLPHLPLYVIADAIGVGDDKIDPAKQIWEVRLLVVHAKVSSKMGADKRHPSRRNVIRALFTESCSIANSPTQARHVVSAEHAKT